MGNRLQTNSMRVEANKKLELLRIKFLRLAFRLGIQNNPNNNVIVSQVLQRLVLLPSSDDDDQQLQLQLELPGGPDHHRLRAAAAFSSDREHAIAAEQLAAAAGHVQEAGCTILVLGKTGVGKSATINSIFDDEVKCGTNSFQLGTKKVRVVVGTVQGIKLQIIDTPGLVPLSSCSDRHRNEKTLHSIKRFIKKTPPHIVLYVDRLDMPIKNDDYGDISLLRTITRILGSQLWYRTIVVLTHAMELAPPDHHHPHLGGASSSYDTFVTQKSHFVQKTICQAVGMMQIMNPIILAENHSRCRKNSVGQRVLPNGQVWVPCLLLLSFASMIMDEANDTLLKLQTNTTTTGFWLGRMLFGTRSATPVPLNFLFSSLFQSIPRLCPQLHHLLKFPAADDADDYLSSDSDGESDNYDDFPPIKVLTKAQLANLTTGLKAAYFDELKYREKVFLKKQFYLKGKKVENYSLPNEEEHEFPITFDSRHPTYLNRFPSDTFSYWLMRPIESGVLPKDHEFGYNSFLVGRFCEVKDSIPISFLGMFCTEKNGFGGCMEIASKVKHVKGKETSLHFKMDRTMRPFYATLISSTRLVNHRKNKASFGTSVTLLGDGITTGMKVEDKLLVKKRLQLVLCGAAVAGKGGVTYGSSFEATLRDKYHPVRCSPATLRDEYHPVGCSPATLGLSLVDNHGSLTVASHFKSVIPIGWFSKLTTLFKLNNKGTGTFSVCFSSSEHLQIAIIGLMIPLLRKLLLGCPQELQFGQR